MSKIQLLDNATIDKIAAGEVVERCASVVKELVENSIDANSKSIKIDLIDSGIKCLIVTDDGVGMERSDAKLAFSRHATSKLLRDDAIYLTSKRLDTVLQLIYDKGLQDENFCPETMGKLGQIGTIEEVTRFCKIDKIYTPCVDFGHINAREFGSLKTEKDYLDRLNFMIDQLGYEKMKNFCRHHNKVEEYQIFFERGERSIS